MKIETIECPNCKKSFESKVYQSINLTERPWLKKVLCSGKINVSQCPSCKTEIKHRSHLLVTLLNPPKWIWLVSRKHKSPVYKEEFLSKIVPSKTTKLNQDVVYVDFGKPCSSLKYVLSAEKPDKPEEWVGLGQLYSGEQAIECYKRALMLDRGYSEAKKLLHNELDILKTYS